MSSSLNFAGSMEVLLLQDIPGIGKKDDLLVVKEGYALNNLLPHRKALVATPTVRKRYAEQIRHRAEQRMQEQELKKSAAGQLEGKVLSFTKKATKTGKLYAAITEKHIAEAAKAQHTVELNEKDIVIPEQIKALGEFEVKIMFGDTHVPVGIKVEQEK